jgi:O-acetyl-ADP-ribose deacetylase (regulator of RNase III)
MQQVLTERHLDNGLMLQVVHGDITAEDSDAIVNAANTQLQHGAGVAGAIVKKGGSSIQEESDAIGQVPTGSAAVTGAGDLAASFVIHAVGPVWQGGTENEEELLGSAVRASLEAAAGLQLESISMPALSSGIFGFPKTRCAEIIVHEIQQFAVKGPTTIRTVRCTNIDIETVREFQDIVNTLTF